MWYAFLRFWIQIVFTLVFKIRVIGRENVPKSGGALLASNHQSYLDPILVGAGLHRQMYIMARRSLFEHFFLFTWLIKSLNAFPVERDRGDIGAVRQALRHLAQGRLLLAFPEATRTHTGEVGALKRGLFVIAARADVPVVPTVIDGAFESWPRNRRMPRPGKITVAFGKPLLPRDFAGDSDEMALACREALVSLQREARNPLERSRA